MSSTDLAADLTTNPALTPESAESAPKSNSSRHMRWATVITVIIAVVLLFFALKGADWQSMLDSFRHGRLDLLALAFLGLIGSYVLRGARWQVLLNAEKPVPFLTAFWATSIGYLGNSVLPARAGEVIRSVMIARKASISASFVLATALTERVLDALALVLFGSLALLAVGSIPAWLISAAEVMAVLGVIGLGVFYILPRFESQISALIHRLPIPARFKTLIATLAGEFLTGMRAIHAVRRLLYFIVLTIGIWAIDAFAALLVAWSFGISISLPEMIILLAAMGLASAAPSTPGFVGIYQFVAVTVLVPFGVTKNDALVFIIAFQAVTYLVVFVSGGLGLWRMHAFGQPLSRLAAEAPENITS